MALNKAKVFVVTSVKGGVGKTTTLLNLAGIYSRMKKRVLILDLDLYSGDVASILNVDYKCDIYNLFEDINNNRFTTLDDYTTTVNDQIKLLPAPKDPRFARKIHGKILDVILYKASLRYDIILIDTNHILTDINLFALDYSDKMIYVINNDSMNLKNMKTMVSILNDMKKTNYVIILNESNNKGKNYDKYIIEGKILTLDDNVYKKYKNTIRIYNLIASDLLKESKGD